jgi:hypothetical protein
MVQCRESYPNATAQSATHAVRCHLYRSPGP